MLISEYQSASAIANSTDFSKGMSACFAGISNQYMILNVAIKKDGLVAMLNGKKLRRDAGNQS